MSRYVLPIFGIFLGGCVAQPEKAARVSVSGPYALTVFVSDTRQIQQLAAARQDIGGKVLEVEAVGRDRVCVKSGRNTPSEWSGIVFFAVRERGHWRIDEQTPFERFREPKVVVH